MRVISSKFILRLNHTVVTEQEGDDDENSGISDISGVINTGGLGDDNGVVAGV
jgi:hypothetical protein